MLNIFKKKSVYSFSILLSVIVLASCSKTPANLQVIPQEATIVSSIDVFSIATKSRLDKLSDLQMVKAAMEKMSEAERAQHKRTKKLAKSLNASYEQAKVIGEMTASKGIHSKTIDEESDDEELSMTPAMASAVAAAAAKARELKSKASQ